MIQDEMADLRFTQSTFATESNKAIPFLEPVVTVESDGRTSIRKHGITRHQLPTMVSQQFLKYLHYFISTDKYKRVFFYFSKFFKWKVGFKFLWVTPILIFHSTNLFQFFLCKNFSNGPTLHHRSTTL